MGYNLAALAHLQRQVKERQVCAAGWDGASCARWCRWKSVALNWARIGSSLSTEQSAGALQVTAAAGGAVAAPLEAAAAAVLPLKRKAGAA